MFNNIILKINILSFMTGIPVIPGVLFHPGCPFVIPSRAEGSVNSFYRFLHSLCSVEMTIHVCSL